MSSYVFFVPHSLTANCQCIMLHICCEAGAISACHLPERLLASSVVIRKKTVSLHCPFIHRLVLHSFSNMCQLRFAVFLQSVQSLCLSSFLAIFQFSTQSLQTFSKHVSFCPPMPPSVYIFWSVYLPLLLPVCPLAEFRLHEVIS